MNALTYQEMAETEGGVFPLAAPLIWLSGVLVGTLVSHIAENWPDFKQGVMEGYTSTMNAN